MKKIEITTNNDELKIAADGEVDFAKYCSEHNIPVTWSGKEQVWLGKVQDLDALREGMMEVFGYNDLSSPEDFIHADITFHVPVTAHYPAVKVFGKTIARIVSARQGVICRRHIHVLKKEFELTNTRPKNIIIPEGMVIHIADVNKKILDKEVEKGTISYEIRTHVKGDRDALLKEKNELQKRIAQIDAQLAKLDED